MTDHLEPPDVDELDEIASAFIDGEATAAEVARVASDPGLAARVEALRRVADEVAAVGQVPAGQREAAIAIAIGDMRSTAAAPGDTAAPAPVVPIDSRRRNTRILSVAAAVLLAVLGVALISTIVNRQEDEPDAATTAIEADEREDDSGAGGADAAGDSDDAATQSASEESGGGAAPTTTAARASVGSLGTIDDAADLAATAQLVLDGGTAFGAPLDASAVPPDTKACSGALPPADDHLFEAMADYAGSPAVVVAYVDSDGDRRVRALALSDCGVLADVAL